MLAGTGGAAVGGLNWVWNWNGAPGHQFPIPGYFHLPSHTFNPMAHVCGGDFGSPLVLSRNSAGAAFLQALGRAGKRPGCFQTEGAALNLLGKEGEVEEESGMLPPGAVSWGAEGLRAEIPGGKRVCPLMKMFWVCS